MKIQFVNQINPSLLSRKILIVKGINNEVYKKVFLKNNKKCLIRNATGDDAQEVLNIFLLTHDQTDFLSSYKDETSIDTAFEKQFLTDRETAAREVYLCAIVDGHIVGTASVASIGKNKVKHRAELGVAIDKPFCGMGIGRALVTACIECAKEAGYSQLELEVVSENRNAIALYESIGFTEFGRNPRGFRSRYQGWQELISMRLELD